MAGWRRPVIAARIIPRTSMIETVGDSTNPRCLATLVFDGGEINVTTLTGRAVLVATASAAMLTALPPAMKATDRALRHVRFASRIGTRASHGGSPEFLLTLTDPGGIAMSVA